ncbi:hypothetical protein [Anaeromyxobacter oryzae]|uniref:DUF177 domain-containing protein n=1 Tax=Anaeromyxobacter oryzae TaxID=2918170 RepID=A0ABM7X0F9_9BACT|nr:hypothetical protein [Anaeromyxobacter oryzae]BDG05207.1 hypothetical protein AMOR_42030 [Anaeromyxobacter oryzae]
MEAQETEGLGRFAREHHVHYEVEPEEVVERDRREVVGFEVRLFATHGESKLEAPACPRCVELLRELRSFAEQLVASGDAASRAEIVPRPSALYQSTEVPGADEVAVAVRVRCDAAEHRREGVAEDPCLGGLRSRLDSLHVPRR